MTVGVTDNDISNIKDDLKAICNNLVDKIDMMKFLNSGGYHEFAALIRMFEKYEYIKDDDICNNT